MTSVMNEIVWRQAQKCTEVNGNRNVRDNYFIQKQGNIDESRNEKKWLKNKTEGHITKEKITDGAKGLLIGAKWITKVVTKRQM